MDDLLTHAVREGSAIGIKPMSAVRFEAPRRDGHPLRDQARPALGDVDAQGQHHEVHRGRVPRLGLRDGARAVRGSWSPRAIWGGAGDARADAVVIKDRIADSMFQQLLLRPTEYSVIATPNLNGDYLSDACAARRSAALASRRAATSVTASGVRGHARHGAQVRRAWTRSIPDA